MDEDTAVESPKMVSRDTEALRIVACLVASDRHQHDEDYAFIPVLPKAGPYTTVRCSFCDKVIQMTDMALWAMYSETLEKAIEMLKSRH